MAWRSKQPERLIMKYKSKEAMSAVNMQMFGIKTAVLAKHRKLRKLRTFFEGKKYKNYLGNVTKQQHFEILKASLLREDAFFNANPNMAVGGNPRWDNFCEDCIWLAVLSSCLFDHPIHLIHPDSFDTQSAINPVGAAMVSKPTLIEGITSVRCDH
jgi:hypothetical protein